MGVHGARGDDYDYDGLDEFFGSYNDFTYYPPPLSPPSPYDGASLIDEEASNSTNGWGDSVDMPIYLGDSDTSDSEGFHMRGSHF